MNLLANSDIRNYNTRISVVTLDKVKRTGILSMVDYNFSSDTSTSSTAWASSCWNKLFIACTAASLLDMCTLVSLVLSPLSSTFQ